MTPQQRSHAFHEGVSSVPAPASSDGERPWQRPLWLLLISALVLPALIVVLVAWNERNALLRDGEQMATRTVSALTEHARTVLETHRLVLEQIDARTRGRSWGDIAADRELQRSLAQTADEFPQIAWIGLFDARGRMRANSFVTTGNGLSIADRDYFVAHRDGTAGRLFISEPFEGRLTGTSRFTVSMRRTNADGSFDGIIAVAVSLSYFTEFWKQFAPSVAHVIPLMRADGTMLVRYPAARPRKLAPTAPFMRQIAANPDGGFYVARSQVDGIERMNAYSRIGSYPLYVSFSIGTQALLASWRERLAWHAALALATTLALAALVLLAMRQALEQRRLTARWRETAQQHEAETKRRRQTEAELMQAQKMEAIGQLTGGVAHDFNNLLHAMGLNLRLAERAAGDAPVAQFHDNIRRGIDSASQLTRRLTTFSRRQQLEPLAFDPEVLALRMADLLARTLGDTIELELNIDRGVWPILADLPQTELALLNLAVNARDAMPDGGRLTIGARNVSFSAPVGRLAAGDYVELAVIDAGSGMPAEVAARVFEPFFTTKEIGKGSGLGLSMVHGFATQSGGDVTIDSRLGCGTTVRLLLPRAVGAAAAIEVLREVGIESSRRGGRVLLVEDDPLVRTSMRLTLREAGYTVEEARTGVEALDVLQRSRVDLLVTDYAMPGGTGITLAKRAREMQPGLPVILVTGYTQPALDAEQSEPIADAVLHKPFSAHELVARAEALLRPPRTLDASSPGLT